MTSLSHPDAPSLSPSGQLQPELKQDPPSALEMGLNLLIALAQRRRLIGVVMLISLVLGIATALILKPRYTATTIIMPPTQSSSAASSLLGQLGSLGALSGMGGSSALKSPADLYAGFLQSQTVENAMVQQFDLVRRYGVKRISQARKMLESHTVIDPKGKDGLLRVSVTDGSAEEAAKLANGYVAQTILLSQHLAVSEAAQRRLFLERQLEQSKNKLTIAEEDLKKTENNTGIIQVEAQGRALIESTTTLRAQIAAKEVQYESLKTIDADENPEIQTLKQQLATMRQQLANLEGKRDSAPSGSTGQISNLGLEYIRRLREVKYQEALFEILARQFEAAKMDEAREGGTLQVVDPARVPDYKSGPSRLLTVLGFLAVGLFGVVGWILAQLAWNRISMDTALASRINAIEAEFKHTEVQ